MKREGLFTLEGKVVEDVKYDEDIEIIHEGYCPTCEFDYEQVTQSLHFLVDNKWVEIVSLVDMEASELTTGDLIRIFTSDVFLNGVEKATFDNVIALFILSYLFSLNKEIVSYRKYFYELKGKSKKELEPVKEEITSIYNGLYDKEDRLGSFYYFLCSKDLEELTPKDFGVSFYFESLALSKTKMAETPIYKLIDFTIEELDLLEKDYDSIIFKK